MAEQELEMRGMTVYPSVKEVAPIDDYTLFVEFDTGETGILDMKPVLHFGIFQRIRDCDAFRRVRVAFDTIEWDCATRNMSMHDAGLPHEHGR